MEELTMGTRISCRCKEKGLTLQALANHLGVSNQAVFKREGGMCILSIALPLGIRLTEFFRRRRLK